MTNPQALFVAQPSYAAGIDGKQSWENLPVAAAAARELAEGLRLCGYELAHPKLLKGGNSGVIARNIDRWLREGITVGGSLFFLWTGHGYSDGRKHYLICRNSPSYGVSGFNAIDTGEIGTVIANCRANKILVVLDACYSGLGAEGLFRTLVELLDYRTRTSKEALGYAVFASAPALGEAKEGVLVNALRKVLLDDTLDPIKRRWSDRDRFIGSDRLFMAVRELICDELGTPQYRALEKDQDLIPNPRYRATLLDEI
jgi:hypothetical protein